MNNTDKLLYYLLELVNRNGDARLLIHEGMDFKQIGELTRYALEHGLLAFEENKVKLTANGIHKLQANKKEFKRINKDEWIKPDVNSRVSKIDKNSIFLPSQDELSF